MSKSCATLGAPAFVLIVEDDEAVASLAHQTLVRGWGAQDTVYGLASTLKQALCIIEKGNIPDLILLDLYLPDSQAIDTVDAIVAVVPPTTGILAMSGYYTHIEGKEALAHGATRFLSKQDRFDRTHIMELASRTWAATKGLRARLVQAEVYSEG